MIVFQAMNKTKKQRTTAVFYAHFTRRVSPALFLSRSNAFSFTRRRFRIHIVLPYFLGRSTFLCSPKKKCILIDAIITCVSHVRSICSFSTLLYGHIEDNANMRLEIETIFVSVHQSPFWFGLGVAKIEGMLWRYFICCASQFVLCVNVCNELFRNINIWTCSESRSFSAGL